MARINTSKAEDCISREMVLNLYNDGDRVWWGNVQTDIDVLPTVDAIPREKVVKFVSNIQKIKDEHNENGTPINYGTICGILIEGWKLVEKENENGRDS